MELILVLALLGAAGGGRLSQGALELQVPAELGSSVWEEKPVGLELLGRGEGRNSPVRGARRWKIHYVLVNKKQNFQMAEAHCAQKFRGHLASIHSSQVNEQLRRMAKSGTNQAQVWVGGITASSGGRPYCKWEDGTPWDYNNWASGSRSRNGKTCVALCTAGGHWRSVSCQTHLPFICGY